MGVLADSRIRAQYVDALMHWNYTGYINWKGPARAFVERELGYPTKHVGKLMYDYVIGGGPIYQILETRPEWLEWKYHYDLYIHVGTREVYFETLLDDCDPDDCTILVVSAHDP